MHLIRDGCGGYALSFDFCEDDRDVIGAAAGPCQIDETARRLLNLLARGDDLLNLLVGNHAD